LFCRSHVTRSILKFSFLSADKAVGQQGFRAIWTEVTQDTECQNGFFCARSGYCIDESLKCNNIDNCGPEDTSDEDHCKSASWTFFSFLYD
jgi:hypothetical protein